MHRKQDSNYILGEEEFGRTRSQTRKISESGVEDEAKKPAVKRTSTMAQTAKVLSLIHPLIKQDSGAVIYPFPMTCYSCLYFSSLLSFLPVVSFVLCLCFWERNRIAWLIVRKVTC